MYNKENFSDLFGTNIGTIYLIDTILKVQFVFREKNIATLGELLGSGDSWSNMACIDKLVECGYLCVVKDHETSNYRTYRNLKF